MFGESNMGAYGVIEWERDLNQRSATYIIDRYLNLKNKMAGAPKANQFEYREFCDYYGITKAEYAKVVRAAYLQVCKEYGLKPIR
jgi:hypothetical protein